MQRFKKATNTEGIVLKYFTMTYNRGFKLLKSYIGWSMLDLVKSQQYKKRKRKLLK